MANTIKILKKNDNLYNVFILTLIKQLIDVENVYEEGEKAGERFVDNFIVYANIYTKIKEKRKETIEKFIKVYLSDIDTKVTDDLIIFNGDIFTTNKTVQFLAGIINKVINTVMYNNIKFTVINNYTIKYI